MKTHKTIDEILEIIYRQGWHDKLNGDINKDIIIKMKHQLVMILIEGLPKKQKITHTHIPIHMSFCCDECNAIATYNQVVSDCQEKIREMCEANIEK